MNFMDKISLPELHFRARHGLLPQEYEEEQDFTVSLTVWTDTRAAGASDDLTLGLDYRRLYAAAESVLMGPHRDLLETLANELAHKLLAEAGVEVAQVRVRKEQADFGSAKVPAEVEIMRRRIAHNG